MVGATAPRVEGDVDPPPAAARRKAAWLAVRVVGTIVLAYVGLQVVVANSAELSGAAGYLQRSNWAWVVVAAVAEAISYAAFTLLQRRLLLAGGVAIPLVPLGAMSLAGNAITNSLPGGGAFATVFAYRQFRRRGADEALTTWVLIAFTSLTAAMLALLALVGLVVAGSDGPVGGLVPLLAVLMLGPIVGLAVLLWPRLLDVSLVPVVSAVRRTTGYPRRNLPSAIERFAERLGHVRPRTGQWAVACGWAMANWIADCGCLVLAFQAVGAEVPWRGVLVAYGAAQVAANLPITPGGLGVVEGSLTVALVAFGGATNQTVAAVLLYRILSFWLILPVGWAAWLGLHIEGRRYALVAEPAAAERGSP